MTLLDMVSKDSQRDLNKSTEKIVEEIEGNRSFTGFANRIKRIETEYGVEIHNDNFQILELRDRPAQPSPSPEKETIITATAMMNRKW